ncbi:MAG TPA: hypothetical protein DEF51_00205 [Myxococcales bacterium]|nr:hypothetical protein [Myxococcales bacterium]
MTPTSWRPSVAGTGVLADLAALDALEEELLYVFVGGPSKGEVVATALPQRAGWIVVDGAVVDGESIALSLVRRFEESGYPAKVAAFVLTHPHDDHVGGIPQLLEAVPPEAVWVTAAQPEGPHLLQVCRSMIARLRGLPTSKQNSFRGVRAALSALAKWEEKTGRALGCAVEGQRIEIRGTPVSLDVRAPKPGSDLDAILAELADGHRHRANEASVVLEVLFGESRLVLGGDLPRSKTPDGASLPTGWDTVMTDHPHLAEHVLLKLAHHASRAAWHDVLMAAPPSKGREWTVTPFSSSKLPRDDQMTDLTSRQSPIRVTHPPPAWAKFTGWRLPAVELRSRREAEPTGDAFADAADDIRPVRARSVMAPIWAMAYRPDGSLAGLWRGDGTVEIT